MPLTECEMNPGGRRHYFYRSIFEESTDPEHCQFCGKSRDEATWPPKKKAR